MCVPVCTLTGGNIQITDSAKDAVKGFDVELLQQLPLDDLLFFAMARANSRRSLGFFFK